MEDGVLSHGNEQEPLSLVIKIFADFEDQLHATAQSFMCGKNLLELKFLRGSVKYMFVMPAPGQKGIPFSAPLERIAKVQFCPLAPSTSSPLSPAARPLSIGSTIHFTTSLLTHQHPFGSYISNHSLSLLLSSKKVTPFSFSKGYRGGAKCVVQSMPQIEGPSFTGSSS